MTFDYTKTAESSLRLLTKYGQTVTRRTYTTGTYNPATGTTTPSTADTSRIGAVIPWGRGQTNLRGTLIEAKDINLLLDAEGAVNIRDHYVINSVEYTVVAFEEISPAGTAVLFDLHLRAI